MTVLLEVKYKFPEFSVCSAVQLYILLLALWKAVVCSAGVLFCVGGRGGSGDPFRSIECYSISRNSWFFGPEMNSRRRHVGVISVGGQ